MDWKKHHAYCVMLIKENVCLIRGLRIRTSSNQIDSRS